ncbi:MAG: hypothetical protein GXO86_06580 [Chlorobi bacterium]|nr:hypothetical protein [Chlorobiota bacterium]
MKTFILTTILLLLITYSGCKSCDCDCQGDVNIQNTSGISYSFEIRKKNTVVFEGSMAGNDNIWFGLEEGNFRFVYGEQNPDKEKDFSIKDCETTVIVIKK